MTISPCKTSNFSWNAAIGDHDNTTECSKTLHFSPIYPLLHSSERSRAQNASNYSLRVPKEEMLSCFPQVPPQVLTNANHNRWAWLSQKEAWFRGVGWRGFEQNFHCRLPPRFQHTIWQLQSLRFGRDSVGCQALGQCVPWRGEISFRHPVLLSAHWHVTRSGSINYHGAKKAWGLALQQPGQ